MNLRSTVEAAVLKFLMGLPDGLQRRVAGRPLEIDGQTLAADLQTMLRLQRLSRREGARPSIAQGRAEMAADTRMVGGEQPIGAVHDLTVAGRPARHYLPRGVRRVGEPRPLLVFLHGGGFVYGDLDSHDAPCRVLAEESGVPVLAIDYRLGPEHPFPAAFDDAEAALRWVLDHADELDADRERIALGGDSAGGNLAAWAAITAARDGLPVAYQLLVYPCVDQDRATESLALFGEDLYLTAERITEFSDTYLPTAADRADDRVNLLDVDLPGGLAPALVVTAGFDPLRDEGETYARRLVEAGVHADLLRAADQVHGFLNIVGVGRSSRAVVLDVAARLRTALG